MQCTRILALRKAVVPFARRIESQCISVNRTNFVISRTLHQSPKDNTKNVDAVSTFEAERPEGIWSRFLRKINVFDRNKYRNMMLGYLSYELIADNLNYDAFYKEFNLADTFFSWFLVTELHVWMLMVRYMAEGNNGKAIRYSLAEAMWKDVETRLKKLGTIHAKVKNQQLNELSAQFNAALIGYDEGILSDDKVLASALWRRFFQLEGNNPTQLETLLIYVRKQTNLLDKTPSQELLKNPHIKWLDLQRIR